MKLWRSLEQKQNPDLRKKVAENEFPDGASELSSVSRRNFLKMMGVMTAFAGVAGCSFRRPIQKIRPYAKRPEDLIPGKARYFASAMAIGEVVTGVLVESHQGRPTKIEGNPNHSESRGALNAFHQSSILNLYDPDRLTVPIYRKDETDWAAFDEWWGAQRRRFNKQSGDGLFILSEGSVSPTFHRTLASFMAEFPKARVYRYDPLNLDNQHAGLKAVTGRDITVLRAYDKAKVVVAFDDDFMGNPSGQIANTKRFMMNRDPDGHAMSRLYVLESRVSLTGGKADHRVRIKSSQIANVLQDIIRKLIAKGTIPKTSPVAKVLAKDKFQRLHRVEKAVVDAIVEDLAKEKSASLITAGANQPAAVHGLVYLLNDALKNNGKTLRYVPRQFADADVNRKSSVASISELANALKKGKVDTLVIIGSNPAYNAPGDLEFANALRLAKHKVHVTERPNDTSELVDWILPLSHYLEAWSDLRNYDGQLSIQQPLIRPLYKSVNDIELLNRMLGKNESAYTSVRKTWRKGRQASFDVSWKKWLHEGVVEDSKSRPVAGRAIATKQIMADLEKINKKAAITQKSMELVVDYDYTVLDGRFSNNAWMQELPDPITKLTWDNALNLSPKTAREMGVKSGQIVRVSSGKNNVRAAVTVVPGQADRSAMLTLGYGQKHIGRIGSHTGFDAYTLGVAENNIFGNILTGVSLNKTQEMYDLASTQEHGDMADRPIYREADRAYYKKHPTFAKEMVKVPHSKSLFPEVKYDKGYQWGMSIDLTKCTGCNACVTACQSENNIPIVGKSEVMNGREMHWIRIDRYFEGSEENPKILEQPTTCLQCEMAPCEQVCPVAATTHTEEGLNDMTYNRCIGTRYCANNCPAKVRRFNFFDYHQRNPQSVKKDRKHFFDYMREPSKSVKMQFNPNVSVRMRGVMEKCTYCVQRISEAKIEAKNENRAVRDGEIKTACQQTCPADAIVFGNILDPNSAIARKRAADRDYSILEELHLKPRTTYMAGIRNPHPALLKLEMTRGKKHG